MTDVRAALGRLGELLRRVGQFIVNRLLDWDLIVAQRHLSRSARSLQESDQSGEMARQTLAALSALTASDEAFAVQQIESDYRWGLQRGQGADSKASALLQAISVVAVVVIFLSSLMWSPGAYRIAGVWTWHGPGILLITGGVFILIAFAHSLRAITVAPLHTVALPPPEGTPLEPGPTVHPSTSQRPGLLELLAIAIGAGQRQKRPPRSAYLRRRATDATYCCRMNAIVTSRKLNLVHAAQRRLSWGVVLIAFAAGSHLHISSPPTGPTSRTNRPQALVSVPVLDHSDTPAAVPDPYGDDTVPRVQPATDPGAPPQCHGPPEDQRAVGGDVGESGRQEHPATQAPD